MINKKIINGEKIKTFTSLNYNYVMNLKTGFFARWGNKKKDDPECSKYGPEILDIEISTQCSQGCKFCYKSNIATGKNMTIEEYTRIIDNMPETLSQVALGIGNIDANKDLWKIMEYSRSLDIIPNITINGSRMTNEYYNKLSILCGAIAVSLYDKDICYNAVEELTTRDMDQVNIHALLSDDTYDKCMETLKDARYDKRLNKLNAIVFLWLKPKGCRNDLNMLKDFNKFKTLVDYAMEHNIRIGFDSCSAGNFLKSIKDNKNYKAIEQMVEPCESTLFSYYINVDGVGFPCSFSEKIGIYTGMDVLNCGDFIKDIWNKNQTKTFRDNALKTKDCNGCRMCSIYDLEIKEE